MKMKPLERVLLLLTGLLAAWQIVVGIDGLDVFAMTAYTIAFGVLLVAGLLMIILGFEVLESRIVVIVSTIIPLCLSLGLIWEYLPAYRISYLVFTLVGFAAIILTRSFSLPGRLSTIILAIVHGIAGLVIFLLPFIVAFQGLMNPLFSLVGVGGALIGVGGLALSFLKFGKPVLPKQTILRILPGLLLLMTLCFVVGFKFG